MLGRDDDDVALALGRQFKACATLGARQRKLDARHRGKAGKQVGHIHRRRQVSGGKRAQRAVVHDIRIGNGQNHPRHPQPQPAVEHILQINDVGLAVGAVFVVHAVVGGQRHGTTHFFQCGEVWIHHLVKGVGGRCTWRRLVLHVIRGRQIHQVGPVLFHDFHASGKDELGQVGAVDRGQRLADHLEHLVYAVFFQRALVGLFRGKADAFHVVAKQAAQLVLGSDHRHLGAGIGKSGEYGAAAQVFGVVHHHFAVGVAVVKIIAADAVYRRGHPGDDGQVVRIGEAGHHAIALECRAGGDHARKKRRDAGGHRSGDVVVFTAIDTDHHQRAVHPAITAVVYRKGMACGHAAFLVRGVLAGSGRPLARCMRSRLAVT